MTIRKNSLVLTAAFAGLLSGTSSRLTAASSSGGSNPMATAQAGRLSTALFADADKHSCKGKNSCKGNGGCKSGDNGCKGKNSCKGKGGCATDGSKKN
ncbi:MAG TPA: hypothetical protein VGL72_31970 [Bryobacteraceae bacterium]|jgi:hypothetical protein